MLLAGGSSRAMLGLVVLEFMVVIPTDGQTDRQNKHGTPHMSVRIVRFATQRNTEIMAYLPSIYRSA